jgi:hypothetical protein
MLEANSLKGCTKILTLLTLRALFFIQKYFLEENKEIKQLMNKRSTIKQIRQTKKSIVKFRIDEESR